MPNVSIYLSEDEKEYVDGNVDNFSEFCRRKVRELQQEKIEKVQERKRSITRLFVINISFFVLGVTVLLIALYYTRFKLFTQTEVFVLLVLGLVLMTQYFTRLLDMKLQKGKEDV